MCRGIVACVLTDHILEFGVAGIRRKKIFNIIKEYPLGILFKDMTFALIPLCTTWLYLTDCEADSAASK